MFQSNKGWFVMVMKAIGVVLWLVVVLVIIGTIRAVVRGDIEWGD
jgi:hypothetical protein